MGCVSKVSSPSSELVRLAIADNCSDITGMSHSDVMVFPINERFKAIHHIQKRVLTAHPAPKSNPFKQIPEKTIAREIAALNRISGTMRHSRAYGEWLDVCRNYLFLMLCRDKKFQRLINDWDNISPKSKKHAIRLREKHHAAAAKKSLRTNITSTDITFMDDGVTQEEAEQIALRVNGLSIASLGGTKASREIRISMHPKSSIQSAETAMGSGHHEKKHDIGVQQAGMYSRGEYDKLGDLLHDAKLWFHLKSENAVISSRIYSSYRKQFHEIVAFSEGEKMEKMISRMRASDFNPLAPILPSPHCVR